MLLSSFLYATGLLTQMLGQTYGALDKIILISDLNISVLDMMLASVILARVYEFLLFLSGQESQIPPPEIPYGMYQ